MAAELEIVFLKSEFCRFEDAFKDLKVRIKITDVWDVGEDNIFTAKIITALGMEYLLTDWTETIIEATTKLIKEYDLNQVIFDLGDNCEIDLPLNIGKHTLEININDTTTSSEFEVVPITVDSIKSQYLLGVELQSRTELVFRQELRQITGVELLHISKETPVGAKEFIWNVTDQTLQWDNGEPVAISDQYTDYHLLNYMSTPGITDGDYIKIRVEDIDSLPAGDQVEVVIVDVKSYELEDFQYWINNGYRILTETVIMTGIEPTLYSSDKELVNTGYRYLEPVMNIPKPYSETSNQSFEFPVNMLQCLVELWAQYRGLASGSTRINISLNRVEYSTDAQIVVRGFPYDSIFGTNTATLGLAGLWDRTIYSKNHHGARNKVKNFWQGTLVAGINEHDLRSLALQVAGQIASIDLLIQAGLGRGAGISSRSFSVGGISSSYNTTESAENSLYSGVLTDMQRRLGVGKASAAEQKTGLVQMLKNKVQGGSMVFKY